MSFDFEIVDIRFFFFNGKEGYTVEYCPSLRKWFVFMERTDSNAVYIKEVKKIPSSKDINFVAAKEVLLEYIK